MIKNYFKRTCGKFQVFCFFNSIFLKPEFPCDLTVFRYNKLPEEKMNLYEVREKVESTLSEIGFEDAEKAYHLVRAMLDIAPDEPDRLMTILMECGKTAAPTDSLLHLSHFIDHSLSPYSAIKELSENEALRTAALTAFSASTYLSSLVIVQPTLFSWLFENGMMPSVDTESMKSEAASLSEKFREDDGFLEAMNTFKNRYVFLIAMRELLGMESIEGATFLLSELADAVLEPVYHRFVGSEKGFAVFSLGKHGSREVNFSSDLDLIFFSEEVSPELIRRAQAYVSALSKSTRAGSLYRIDMRLRPEGQSSPLVTSISYFESYLDSRARSWERQAYLRARHSAGDDVAGKRAAHLIEGFVYQSALTIADIQSIIFIKDQIDRSVKNNPLRHVKKGRGGIRDIEFIVQAFQLIFGQQHAELRNPNIFHLLDALFRLHFLETSDYETLKEAYHFLRKVEHYLQLKENRQIFELPEKSSELRSLSRLLGFQDSESYAKYYGEIREKVRGIFLSVFSKIFGEGDIAPISEIILNPDVSEKNAEELLQKYGFRDPKSVFSFLKNLSGYSPRLQTALALSLSTILESVADCADPDGKFFRFFEIFSAYGAPSLFLKLLKSSPSWRNLLLGVISESEALTNAVKNSPSLIDRFTDPEALSESEDPEVLFERMMKMTGQNRKLAQKRFFEHQSFKSAVREFSGAIDFEETGEVLSDSVDLLIRKSIEELRSENIREFAVLALGRLGARETAFGSDADVVYLSENADEKIPVYVHFFNSLREDLQKVIELDPRLRPHGKSAPISVSFKGFESYLSETAELWEKTAYVKCRVLFASSDEAASFADCTIRNFVLSPSKKEDFEEIETLRRKIHESYTKPAEFNLKKDAGGLMDLDFISFLILREHHVRDFDHSTLSNLRRFEKSGFLQTEVPLSEIYAFYRRLENHLRILRPKGKSRIRLEEERNRAELCRFLNLDRPEDFLEKIAHFRQVVQDCFKNIGKKS